MPKKKWTDFKPLLDDLDVRIRVTPKGEERDNLKTKRSALFADWQMIARETKKPRGAKEYRAKFSGGKYPRLSDDELLSGHVWQDKRGRVTPIRAMDLTRLRRTILHLRKDVDHVDPNQADMGGDKFQKRRALIKLMIGEVKRQAEMLAIASGLEDE